MARPALAGKAGFQLPCRGLPAPSLQSRRAQTLKMMTFVSYLLTAFAALLAVPTAVFVFEVLAASFLSKRELIFDGEPDHRGRVAVLVPAHNESVGLQPTLADLERANSVPGIDCSLSRTTAATILLQSRFPWAPKFRCSNDPTKIGKGYALDWGLNYLAKDAPGLGHHRGGTPTVG